MNSNVEWFDPSSFIQHSNRITNIFGGWPSFHDAEILSLSLSIADGEPWGSGSISPTLDMRVHLWEMTKEVTEQGYFVLAKHTLAHLQFRCVEALSFSDFSFQNVIFELEFGIEPVSYPYGGGPIEGPPPNVLVVTIDSSAGLQGQFKCHSAEVVSAVPCDEDGNADCKPD